MRYVVGQTIRLLVKFYLNGDQNTGTLADPETIGFEVQDPAKVDTYYGWTVGGGSTTGVVHVGLGTFYVDIVATQSGNWAWSCEGTGQPTASCENEFYVYPSKLA